MRKRKQQRIKSKLARPDWILFTITMALMIIGLIMVLDASIIEAFTQFSDKYHFVKLQARWLSLGLIAMIGLTFVPISLIKKVSQPVMILTLVLLVAVLIPGIGTKVQGARRWIVMGGLVIQPSELAKLAAVMYFPSWLSKHQRIEPFIGLVGLMTLLLLMEPDLGTAIIIFGVAFSMYYVSGAKSKYIAGIIAGAVVLGLLVIVASPYRLQRLQTFLQPTNDPLGTSYHIRQVLISLGSGGLMGTGFGRSRQKFQFLPESTTDSIFAVIGEEVGFVGAGIVIGLFAILILRMLKLVPSIKDNYAQLLLVGVLSWIGIQTLLNLSAMVALVPLTGVPLPLISYGGSSLVTTMAAIGLAMNASRMRKV